MEDILSKSAREDGSFEAQAFKVEEDCRARYFKMEQFNLKSSNGKAYFKDLMQIGMITLPCYS